MTNLKAYSKLKIVQLLPATERWFADYETSITAKVTLSYPDHGVETTTVPQTIKSTEEVLFWALVEGTKRNMLDRDAETFIQGMILKDGQLVFAGSQLGLVGYHMKVME